MIGEKMGSTLTRYSDPFSSPILDLYTFIHSNLILNDISSPLQVYHHATRQNRHPHTRRIPRRLHLQICHPITPLGISSSNYRTSHLFKTVPIIMKKALFALTTTKKRYSATSRNSESWRSETASSMSGKVPASRRAAPSQQRPSTPCFLFHLKAEVNQDIHLHLDKCKGFTRRWTLQELIPPRALSNSTTRHSLSTAQTPLSKCTWRR